MTTNIITITDTNGVSHDITSLYIVSVIDLSNRREIIMAGTPGSYYVSDTLLDIKTAAGFLFEVTSDELNVLVNPICVRLLAEEGGNCTIYTTQNTEIRTDESASSVKDKINTATAAAVDWGNINGVITAQTDLPSILSEGIWDYSTNTTIEDPSSGGVRLNNADPSLATKGAVSKTSNQGVDFSGVFELLSVGAVLNLREYADVGNFAVSEIIGITDQGTWIEVDFTSVDATSFSADGVDTIIRVLSLGASFPQETRIPSETINEEGYYNITVVGTYTIEDASTTYSENSFQITIYNNSGDDCIFQRSGSTVFEFLGDSVTEFTLQNGEEITLTAVSTTQYNIG